MRRHMIGLIAGALLTASSWSVLANPVTDFENEVRAAYGAYRAALARTNSTDADGSASALKQFITSWSVLRSKWEKSPPPHYASDGRFATTLAAVADAASKAASELSDLPKAHLTLEKIRDELAELRARNGVTVFSDRMNAYHEAMEHMLSNAYQGFSAAGLGELREDAAVLMHLAREMEKSPPKEAISDATFTKMLADVRASVEALLMAARAGDAEAAKKAVGALKRPYAQMFMRFG